MLDIACVLAGGGGGHRKKWCQKTPLTNTMSNLDVSLDRISLIFQCNLSALVNRLTTLLI